jgi:hypothetical protein
MLVQRDWLLWALSIGGLVASHPHLAEVWNRGIHDFESLGGADLVGFSMLMDQLFFIYQEMYYQQLEGHLDPRLWCMTEAPLSDVNAYPGVQAWWRSRSHWFSDDFVKFIDQVQQTAKPPRLYPHLRNPRAQG